MKRLPAFTRITFFLFALIGTAGTARAQSDMGFLVNENFEDISSDWFTGVSSDYELKISNGKYYISAKKSPVWPHVEAYPFEKEHYKLSADIELIKEKKGSGAGLIWGGDSGENFYVFMVHEGAYTIMHHTDHSIDFLVEWTMNENVKMSPAVNKLEIEQENGSMKLRLNGQEVYSGKPVKFYGSYVGIFVEPGTEVAADNIVLSTPEIKINLAPGTETTKRNMGEGINTSDDETLGLISPDGNYLYYFRRYHHPEKGSEKEGEAWMVSKKSSWTDALPLDKPINCSKTNFVATVLPDNNTLMTAHHYNSAGEIDGTGFSVSTKEKNGWGIPKNLEISDFSNDRDYLEGCMSADQKVLIMALKRADTKGESDLYVSFHFAGQKWSAPINMGNINSGGSEIYPFLAPDERTIYFSSNGWPGFGGQDIFISHRLDDTWKNWSEPQNLGSTINTAHSDCGISVSAKGDKAYISSISNKNGSFDLFEVNLTQSMRPDPVLLIKGKTLEKETNKPLGTSITIHDLSNDKEVGIAHSDPNTGEYEIVLQQGKEYSFYAEKKQYYAIREHMDLKDINEYKEITLDLYLVPMQIGKNIKLNNVFFEHAKATLKNESEAELKSLIKLLNDNEKIKIRLEGHTDNQGPEDLNMKLSQDRADAIKAYLIENGIDASRLEAVGYGETKPVADNRKPHLRRLNRRVEFVLLGI